MQLQVEQNQAQSALEKSGSKCCQLQQQLKELQQKLDIGEHALKSHNQTTAALEKKIEQLNKEKV